MGRFKHAENLLRDSMAMSEIGEMLLDGDRLLGRPEWVGLGHTLKRMQIPDLEQLKKAMKGIEGVAEEELRGGKNDWCLANLGLLIDHLQQKQEPT